ncbi:MAG: hypothetical protein ACRC2T_06110 [Thermoguttaceae bacterium]
MKMLKRFIIVLALFLMCAVSFWLGMKITRIRQMPLLLSVAFCIPNHEQQAASHLHTFYRLFNEINSETDIGEAGFYKLVPSVVEPVFQHRYAESWRSRLVQHDWRNRLYQLNIFDKYNFGCSNPWSTEKNIQERSPYYCQEEAGLFTRICDTSFLMLTRGDTLMKDLPDEAVVVVESVDCGIHWMEPKDLDIETLQNAESPFGIGKLNSYHDGYVYALRKNGEVIKINKDLPKEKVLAILDRESTSE